MPGSELHVARVRCVAVYVEGFEGDLNGAEDCLAMQDLFETFLIGDAAVF